MAPIRSRHLFLLILATFVEADYQSLNFRGSDSTIIRALRELTNQSNADTLNLPANASSIRENITDTFSCENRTYGYYADVDNDCQVFHVCLPSQTPAGRNVTYRWSFICPNETIFNQEVLTCTRVPDSIDCKDSPLFYHLNAEIGRVTNKTDEVKEKKDNRKIQKRKPEKRRENIVMDNTKLDSIAMDTIIKDMASEDLKNVLPNIQFGVKNEEQSPMLLEAVIEAGPEEDAEQEEKYEEELDRIVMERNMRNERQMKRGALKYLGDHY